MTLRDKFTQELKKAMLSKDKKKTATLRLILAGLKDRDIATRSQGESAGISDTDILIMLQTMIKQRKESIVLYKENNRPDMAQEEQEEIKIIQEFMPPQLSFDEVTTIITQIIKDNDLKGLKQMGVVMGILKEKYAGHMDFTSASKFVKQALSNDT